MKRVLAAAAAFLAAAALAACGGGDSQNAFCDQAKESVKTIQEVQTSGGSDADAQKKQLDALSKEFTKLQEDAPEAIKDDLGTVVSTIKTLNELLAKAPDGNLQSISEADQKKLQELGPKSNEAYSNVQEYFTKECKIDTGTSGGDGGEAPATTPPEGGEAPTTAPPTSAPN